MPVPSRSWNLIRFDMWLVAVGPHRCSRSASTTSVREMHSTHTKGAPSVLSPSPRRCARGGDAESLCRVQAALAGPQRAAG
jgi:hypothetical protein